MKRAFKFSFLDSKFFNSKVKSANVKNGERWLGFFLGPALVACVGQVCGGYANLYYTDVLDMSPIAGGLFLALMPIISKIIDAITNIIMGRIVDNTTSRQGKARPWILVAGPMLALSSILLYLFPGESIAIQVLWATVTYNLYHCISNTVYVISNTLMTPLSTRNSKQRDTLSMAYSMGFNMIPGMLGSILFPIVLLPYMGVDKGRWITVMFITGLLAIPATLLQYYFTRERITEETAGTIEETPRISLKQQIKGCTSSQYWMVIMGIIIVHQIISSFQTTSVLYYCNWVLGSYNDGTTMPLLNAIGQAPLGFGIIILWPLVKKFSKRNVMMVGCAISVIGNLIGYMAAKDMVIVLIGLIIRSIGTLPITYTLLSMLADALDHVEWMNGFRCDGFSSSVYSIVFTVIAGFVSGVFNLMLGITGYVAPASDGSFVVQSSGVQNWFTASMFLIPAVGLFIIAFLLAFFNVEKELPVIRADIVERHKAEAEARGEVYITQEEKAMQEQAELDRIAEEKRIEELKEKCVRKNLNFDEENEKYLKKLVKKNKG